MESKRPGLVYSLKVKRDSDLGFVLDLDNGEEVLLHKSEAKGKHEEGAIVEVFLYQDHQGRLAATETMPKVQLDSLAWLDVSGVNHKLGVFLYVGIKKDVLLSKDDLPESWEEWPKLGDKLYSGLKLDKKGRLFADLGTEEEMVEQAEAATEEMFNQHVSGHVYKMNESGVLIFTDSQHIGFIHNDELKVKPRLGQKLEARVSFVREDGRMNLSMRPRKEQAYNEDSERIYQYLRENKGQMPLTDKSSPEEIKAVFQMSKAAFKRALGKLLKEEKIIQENGKTYLQI
ncbi:CvfB family protein [Fictibacillus barbaricus]|uniref:RNA-binding protein (Virulence factor B family) n=1 Tax=Fictibacillus barbaricus TaxID=182136 RepID=A0ABU1TYL5_9BACL|nr:S1-like domain-containing RNA-binding protein [Fictibacillus barbaricus]MDR7072311.1 putative RNA-binding protein (virulence factor B family) [Fictibacillus barbaricus]